MYWHRMKISKTEYTFVYHFSFICTLNIGNVSMLVGNEEFSIFLKIRSSFLSLDFTDKRKHHLQIDNAQHCKTKQLRLLIRYFGT